MRSVCQGATGYALLGQYKAIGVATWGIGSPYDKWMAPYIPPGQPSVTALVEPQEQNAVQESSLDALSNLDLEAS